MMALERRNANLRTGRPKTVLIPEVNAFSQVLVDAAHGMDRHRIFGVHIDDISPEELDRCVDEWLSGSLVRVIVTPNPEFILISRRDKEFRETLGRSDLSLPDGVGLRFAVAAMTDRRLRFRHTGVDTLGLLATACARKGAHLVLLGGAPGVAEKAAANLSASVQGLSVAGVDPGKVRSERLNDDIPLDRLGSAAVIAVGLGQGKQEAAMERLREIAAVRLPNLRILIGVGGAFDMLSGVKPRAPVALREIGLEWAWRALVEPTRIFRILRASVVFPATVVWDTLKHRRFLRALRSVIPEILRQISSR